jgi:hypothetical protein
MVFVSINDGDNDDDPDDYQSNSHFCSCVVMQKEAYRRGKGRTSEKAA